MAEGIPPPRDRNRADLLKIAPSRVTIFHGLQESITRILKLSSYYILLNSFRSRNTTAKLEDAQKALDMSLSKVPGDENIHIGG